jgi:hypothetical protein
MSAGMPAILTENVGVFSQFVKAEDWIAPLTGHTASFHVITYSLFMIIFPSHSTHMQLNNVSHIFYGDTCTPPLYDDRILLNITMMPRTGDPQRNVQSGPQFRPGRLLTFTISPNGAGVAQAV